MRLPKIRFSIRTMFVASAIAGIFSWWIAVPLTNAHQFVNRIKAEEYELAAGMFAVEGTAAMITEWEPRIRATAWLPKLSWTELAKDMIRGRRRVELTVTYRKPDDTELPGFFPLEASVCGIHTLYAPRDHGFQTSDATLEEFP